jgi:phage FluMu protein Com
MIKFRCVKCNSKISVPDGSAGKKCKCPKCNNIQIVPEPEPLIQFQDPITTSYAMRSKPHEIGSVTFVSDNYPNNYNKIEYSNKSLWKILFSIIGIICFLIVFVGSVGYLAFSYKSYASEEKMINNGKTISSKITTDKTLASSPEEIQKLSYVMLAINKFYQDYENGLISYNTCPKYIDNCGDALNEFSTWWKLNHSGLMPENTLIGQTYFYANQTYHSLIDAYKSWDKEISHIGSVLARTAMMLNKKAKEIQLQHSYVSASLALAGWDVLQKGGTLEEFDTEKAARKHLFDDLTQQMTKLVEDTKDHSDNLEKRLNVNPSRITETQENSSSSFSNPQTSIKSEDQSTTSAQEINEKYIKEIIIKRFLYVYRGFSDEIDSFNDIIDITLDEYEKVSDKLIKMNGKIVYKTIKIIEDKDQFKTVESEEKTEKFEWAFTIMPIEKNNKKTPFLFTIAFFTYPVTSLGPERVLLELTDKQKEDFENVIKGTLEDIRNKNYNNIFVGNSGINPKEEEFEGHKPKNYFILSHYAINKSFDILDAYVFVEDENEYNTSTWVFRFKREGNGKYVLSRILSETGIHIVY